VLTRRAPAAERWSHRPRARPHDSYDWDSDGRYEAVLFDDDRNGRFERIFLDAGITTGLIQDATQDGYFETVALDADRDGRPERLFYDGDRDGYPEWQCSTSLDPTPSPTHGSTPGSPLGTCSRTGRPTISWSKTSSG
jgi:hypothetical protein